MLLPPTPSPFPTRPGYAFRKEVGEAPPTQEVTSKLRPDSEKKL